MKNEAKTSDLIESVKHCMEMYPEKDVAYIVRAVSVYEAALMVRNEATHFLATGKGAMFLRMAIKQFNNTIILQEGA